MHRYTVISSDCHAGADLADYRPYLETRWHEEFDGWLQGYENPFRDLTAPDANRNWDSGVRQAASGSPGRCRLRAAPRRAPSPQPVAGRMVRRAAGPPSGDRPDPAQRRGR